MTLVQHSASLPIAGLVGLLTLLGTADAQWLHYPDPRVPRAADGTPVLTAPAPRSVDGHPDLSGVWHVQAESMEEKRRRLGPQVGRIFTIGMEPETVSMYAGNVLLDYRPEDIVMSPEAEAIYQRRAKELPMDVLPARRRACRHASLGGIQDRSDTGRHNPHSRNGWFSSTDLHRSSRYYSKPFSFKVTHLLEVDSDIFEYICTEAERDLAHMTLPK